MSVSGGGTRRLNYGTKAVRGIIKIFHLLGEVLNTGHSESSVERIPPVENNQNGVNALLIPRYVLEVRGSKGVVENQPSPQPSPIGEGVSNSHPELVSGSHQILKHKGQSDVQNMLKQVQHDGNSPKRTYSPINLFTYSLKKRAAFTLGEVLITLGIIGVVAAMTMPSLITNYQKKQTVTQLKKVYSELSQAAEMAKLEYGDMSLWDYSLSGSDFFNKYLASYIKISKIKVGNLSKQGIVYYNTSGAIETSFTTFYDDADVITLPSGAQIFIANARRVSVQDRSGFLVDLNGFKRPNKLGRDLFVFSVAKNGVLPFSNDDREILDIVRSRDEFRDGPSADNYQCNRQGRGMWCAALIMADGWQIRDDYPW